MSKTGDVDVENLKQDLEKAQEREEKAQEEGIALQLENIVLKGRLDYRSLCTIALPISLQKKDTYQLYNGMDQELMHH